MHALGVEKAYESSHSMPPWTNRQDARTSDLINQAVKMDALEGAVKAWTFLVKAGIPEEIICRVLSQPSRRRASLAANLGQAGDGG